MATSNYVANFNLTSWANAQAQLNSGIPQDVTIPMMDENGNIKNITVPNRGMFQKRVWDDVGGALGQFNKTFYVDNENGDDNNDGSENSPFKTIERATSLAPSAYIRAILLSDYELTKNERIGIANNTIEIYANSYQIKYTEDKRQAFWIGFNCFVDVYFEGVKDRPCILVENEDNNEDYKALFMSNAHERYANINSGLRLSFKNCSNSEIIKTKSKGIYASTGIVGWVDRRVNIHFEIGLVHSEDCKIIYDNWICNYANSTGTFSFSQTFVDNDKKVVIQDNDGNEKEIKDIVAGIVKDSDGKPRNILSDIIF